MKRTAATIAILGAMLDVGTTRAELPKIELPRLGIFRKKKEDPQPAPKPAPNVPATAQQPPQAQPQPGQAQPAANSTKAVIEVLKSDTDENRRVRASEALRVTDPRVTPEVIPALMNSLQQDPSANVRASVAESIGKLKPTSQQAGAILEQAVVGDPSEPVRKAAQQALWQYHLNGYRSSSSNTAIPQTAEPPLAKAKESLPKQPKVPTPGTTVSKQPAPTPSPLRPITTGIGKGAIYPQTIEPPLAQEKVTTSVVEKVQPTVEVKPPMPMIVVPPLPVEKQPDPAPVSVPSVSVPLPPATNPLVPSIPPPAATSTLPTIPIVPAVPGSSK